MDAGALNYCDSPQGFEISAGFCVVFVHKGADKKLSSATFMPLSSARKA
jgi:hypothetical protein